MKVKETCNIKAQAVCPLGEKKRKRFQSDKVFIVLTLIWPTIHFLLFFVYIYSNTIWLSFHTLRSTGYEFFGFQNFVNFFREIFSGDSALYFGIINSLKLFLFTILITIPLSVYVAFCFFKKIAGYQAFRIIYFIPNVISIVIMTMVFRWAFDLDIGFMNRILNAVGIYQPEMGYFGENNSFNMVMLYSVWVGIGYYAMLISGGMSRIPPEVLESARIDGAGFFTEFVQIVLPLVSSIISTLTIMSMGSIFSYFLPVMLLTAGGPNGHSNTIALQMTSMATSNAPGSATIGVVCSCIGVPLILGVKALLERCLPEVEF